MLAAGERETSRKEGIKVGWSRWFVCIPLLAAAVCGFAEGQPDEPVDPIVPDRPGFYCGSLTVPKGVFQVEAGFAYSRSEAGVAEEGVATPTVFRIGLIDGFELRVNFAGYNRLELSGPAGSADESGAGSVAVGAKWQFAEAAEEGHRPSMALLFSVDLPVGSRFARPEKATPGVVWASDFSLPAGFGLAANVGVSAPFDGGADERFAQTFLAASLSRAIARRVALFVEIAASHPDSSKGNAQTFLDGGLTWLVNHDLQLDFSVIKGLTEEAGDWALLGGVSFRFR